MLIDLAATAPWYLDHLAPVWLALPEALRGTAYVPSSMRDRAIKLGFDRVWWPGKARGNLTLVAGVKDARRMRSRGSPTVYLAHGIGQWYSDAHSSYPGGRNREGVVLFLCANEQSAAANRAMYPASRSVAIGMPKLDVWADQVPKPWNKPPVVATSFHWNCHVAPESEGAFEYYKDALIPLKDEYTLLGHAHPRLMPTARKWYQQHHVAVAEHFDEVMERADVYMCDNSSTLYEFAATGRPVVVLNAPWFRRDVEHGLRFWEFADVGVQCDSPESLRSSLEQAVEDADPMPAHRRVVCEQVFTKLDGMATERAVAEIMEEVS